MSYSIKEMVAGGKLVAFSHYRQKELWYKTECGFEFPVPIEDTGDGIFLATDKVMLFMHYLRKHIESIEAARQQQLVGPIIYGLLSTPV